MALTRFAGKLTIGLGMYNAFGVGILVQLTILMLKDVSSCSFLLYLTHMREAGWQYPEIALPLDKNEGRYDIREVATLHAEGRMSHLEAPAALIAVFNSLRHEFRRVAIMIVLCREQTVL